LTVLAKEKSPQGDFFLTGINYVLNLSTAKCQWENVMNTATARRPNTFGSAPAEKKAVPTAQDVQLQKLITVDGWEMGKVTDRKVELSKVDARGNFRTMIHLRKRA